MRKSPISTRISDEQNKNEFRQRRSKSFTWDQFCFETILPSPRANLVVNDMVLEGKDGMQGDYVHSANPDFPLPEYSEIRDQQDYPLVPSTDSQPSNEDICFDFEHLTASLPRDMREEKNGMNNGSEKRHLPILTKSAVGRMIDYTE